MFKHLLSLLILFSFFSTLSQEKKSILATRIEHPPKIDGVLDDEVWQSLPSAKDFNMVWPENKRTVNPDYKTEVKIAYDNTSVYFAAYMYDPNPDQILSQFSQRDEVSVQADLFYIALNTYNDGINETRFYVTSAGTIGDSRASQSGEDYNYNVVFNCKISKDTKGWYAEFKIPYNALRFPVVEIQDWSVNFFREIRTIDEKHSWNFVDNEVGESKLYNGLITGVSDIEPPIRLTFYPFVQGLVSTMDGETETKFTGGMDLKYGLTDSFTLDATLIPDFGQAAFDNVSLNLGPFEQTFGENRSFFTEGVSLFSKARIFYSRRIGGPPSGSVGALEENEEITDYPSDVNILNAIKLSGRTKKGLGIGFLNSITGNTYAKIYNTETEEKREVLIEPLANYNVIVLDQQFNGNSSVSLINTNVIRSGSEFRDANVTAGAFSIADKQNRFRATGRAVFSNVNYGEGFKSGFLSEIDLFKTKGNVRYRVGHDFSNTTLDINDLGLNLTNNFNNFNGKISYEIFKPTRLFNKYRIGLTAKHDRLYKPSVQTESQLGIDAFVVTKKRLTLRANANYHTEKNNYFEPRVKGRFVTFSPYMELTTSTTTDYRKKLALDARFSFNPYFDDPQYTISFTFNPRYRFSNHFIIIWNTDYYIKKNEKGYVYHNSTDIYFGQRISSSFTNSLTASYNFDPYKAIDLRFRNSWGIADYSENLFFILNEDGTLTETDYDIDEYINPNKNFNIWNIDLSFRWRFAPGSEATLLYRNKIFNQDKQSTIGFGESLENLFEQPARHTVSLRITYFVDYNNIKYLFKKS